MTYDAVCPFCGKLNHSLYLEETEGWMECECCGKTTQNLSFQRIVKAPAIRMEQINKRIAIKLKPVMAQ